MGKNFWYKNKNCMMKRHDICNLAEMENGLVYCGILWFLMGEAVDHDAELRYSEKKAYTARTLAPVCHTDAKTMQDALDAFVDLELIEIREDGTIYIELVAENIGCETKWAQKKKAWREKQGQTEDNSGQTEDKKGQCPQNVLKMSPQKEDMSDKSIEYRVKSIEIRDKIDKKKKIEDKSSILKEEDEISIEDIFDACEKYGFDYVDCKAFYDYYSERSWNDAEGKRIKNVESLLKKWNENNKKEIEEV